MPRAHLSHPGHSQKAPGTVPKGWCNCPSAAGAPQGSTVLHYDTTLVAGGRGWPSVSILIVKVEGHFFIVFDLSLKIRLLHA